MTSAFLPGPRLGVSSASVPSLSPGALIDALANLGYQGVEWRVADTSGLDPHRPWDARHNNRCTLPEDPATVARITQQCRDAGLTVFGLSPYLAVGDLDHGLRLLELAAAADQARLRLWAPATGQGRYQTAVRQFHDFLERLLPRAQALGVQLALEVHQRTICSSPALAMRIAEQYPAEHLGIIYDMGNLAIEGREDVALSLDLMGNHLAHVQVKNVAWKPGTAEGEGWSWHWAPPESGLLPLRSMLGTLARTGFADWISIEDFDTSHHDQTKLQRNLHRVRDYLTTEHEALCP